MSTPVRLASILVVLTSIGMKAQTDPRTPPPKLVNKIQMTAGMARLEKKVDSKSAKPGDVITAKLMDDIHCPDGLLMPKGATLSGRVVEVQPSEKKSDSKLVLVFDQLTINGKPPIPVKVTLRGLVSPPVSGPDSTGATPYIPYATPPIANSGPTGGIFEPQREGIKDTSVPGVSLNSSLTDPNSGTMTSMGKNTQLPLWTQLRIIIAPVPPNAVIK